jgi:hypothetical protein
MAIAHAWRCDPVNSLILFAALFRPAPRTLAGCEFLDVHERLELKREKAGARLPAFSRFTFCTSGWLWAP